MMNPILLAQIEASQNSRDLHGEALNFIWQQITDLSWLHAVVAISVGIVYMLYGWRIFRVLVVICFGLAGCSWGFCRAAFRLADLGRPDGVGAAGDCFRTADEMVRCGLGRGGRRADRERCGMPASCRWITSGPA